MNAHAARRAKERIAQLSGHGLGLVSFWQAAAPVLTSLAPHDASPCWYTLDPSSLLVTSHYQTELPELPPEWLAHEYFADDSTRLPKADQCS